MLRNIVSRTSCICGISLFCNDVISNSDSLITIDPLFTIRHPPCDTPIPLFSKIRHFYFGKTYQFDVVDRPVNQAYILDIISH